MTLGPETQPERDRRQFQRALFDGVADRYDASRPGYSDGALAFIAATAGLAAGSRVLEVGCGTGQLTAGLAGLGFSVTAIDIGPSMITAARRRLSGPASAVDFQVTSFEDFAGRAPASSFDLVISGAAFHWIDPEIRFHATVRLLRPGGWLALAGSADRYDDPVGASLDAMWVRHDHTGDLEGAWSRNAPGSQVIADTGLFDAPVRWAGKQRLSLPASTVIDVERTRATYLSWPEDTRRDFTAELRALLRPHPQVPLTRETSVTMARAVG